MADVGRRGTWRTYTTADGLAALQVEHIVEDREGCLWFATCSGGVSRFDGESFRTHTTRDGLRSDLVHAMLCDSRGRLWFGTFDRGVCWYDGHTFHGFAEDGWASRTGISYLFEDAEGRVWAGGMGALGVWDGSDWQDLTPEYRRLCGADPGPCWGIAQDRDGRLWFGHTVLTSYDGRSLRAYGPADGLLDRGDPFGVVVDGGGDLWVGRQDRIWRRQGQAFEVVPMPCDGVVRKLQADRRGRVWACLSRGGALCFDGTRVQHLAAGAGLAFDTVVGMLHDRGAAVPAALSLAPGYPNPFNAATVIRVHLPLAAQVDVAVHDVLGQRVATLLQGWRPAGTYALHWDGRDDGGRALASGTYLTQLRAGRDRRTSKLTLLR